MASKYNLGDTAFVVESSLFVREVKIVKISGSLVTLLFADTPGGVRLRESRLIPSPEADRAGDKKHHP